MKTRSENEMFSLILDTAKADPRVHAVVMAGSRADTSNPHDIFMDYDISYIVDDYHPFLGNLDWARRFGEPMIIQLPNHMDFDDLSNIGYETFLMQFCDGTRIDLTVETLEHYESHEHSEPERVLWDPEGLIPPLPTPDGSCYFVKPPTAKDYDDCCNEYWWLHAYAAKELWRGNLVFAKYWFDGNLRRMYERMLGWYLAKRCGYGVSMGKHGKFMRKYMTDGEWELLLSGYADAEPEHIWTALQRMDDFFRIAAKSLAADYGFAYLQTEDDKVTAYLKHIRALSKDADEIYSD